MYGALGQTAVDPAVQALLAALRAQESGLSSVAGRLSAASARIPHTADLGWEGPARNAYEVAVSRLAATVACATDAVGLALRETRTAISSLERATP